MRRAGVLLLAGLLLLARPSAADPPAEARPHDASHRHMENGVKLYRAGDFDAALAEFEAAYRERPRAAPLLDVALCEKALFRYPRAVAALERALGDHGDTLEAGDRAAAEKAIADMRALLGYVEVTLAPPEARLFVDGRAEALSPGKPLAVGPGTHRIEARAEGFRSAETSLTLASGEHRAVSLSLAAERGRLAVRAPDDATAIHIDGALVGHGAWTGSLPPGTHVVVLSNAAGGEHTADVAIVAGQLAEITAGERGVPATLPVRPVANRPPALPVRVRGPYAVADATLFFPMTEPASFGPTAGNGGAAAGIRLGYRFSPLLGAEAQMEYASVAVTGHSFLAGDRGAAASVDYSLSAFRVGAGLRLMTSGERLRFVQVFGLHGAYDSIGWSGDTRRPRAAGLGVAALVEPGLEIDIGGVLLGLTGQIVASTGNGLNAGGGAAPTYGGPLLTLGAGVRIGYRLW